MNGREMAGYAALAGGIVLLYPAGPIKILLHENATKVLEKKWHISRTPARLIPFLAGIPLLIGGYYALHSASHIPELQHALSRERFLLQSANKIANGVLEELGGKIQWLIK